MIATDEKKRKLIIKILVGIIALSIIGTLVLTAPRGGLEFNNEICNELKYTPSWIKDGKIINTGYKKGISVVDLINENISFYWIDTCHWCHQQIDEWGDDWELYQKANLTVECKI